MSLKWPLLDCRYCEKKVRKCAHRIPHDIYKAPCDCPMQGCEGGVEWIAVYASPEGTNARTKVYECCQCAEIWIVEGNHNVIVNPSALQVEEAILGKYHARN